MTDATLWWLAAGGLIAAELVSGTFYLLMLAIGLVAGALAAHAGLAAPAQWVSAAIVGGTSVLLWRGYQRSRPSVAPAQSNPDVHMDVGETVQVAHWRADGSCSVHYRGAAWEAALMPGEIASSGAYTIAEVVGSRLILKKSHSH